MRACFQGDLCGLILLSIVGALVHLPSEDSGGQRAVQPFGGSRGNINMVSTLLAPLPEIQNHNEQTV